MKWCKVCGVSALTPLWKDYGGNQWHRCGACGSDSSEATYPPDHYTDEYLTSSLARTGGIEAAKEYVRSNIEWFDHHKDKCGGLDFLDVGCLEGAAMMVAAEHGWRVHGFDVIEAARQPGCSTIHPYFAASLFPQVYHAVMCREVLEHVEGWRGFLSELAAVTARNGILQLQTPRPMATNSPTCYQPAHLFIVSPAALERAVRDLGFTILDSRQWEGTDVGPAGQGWLLHLTDKPG
jgi:uncharacterized protein (DUF779 family)